MTGEIDWSKTTFDGSRREQLRRWRALTVRQRLEALDEMTELAHTMKLGKQKKLSISRVYDDLPAAIRDVRPA